MADPMEILLATGGYDHTVKTWNAKTGVNQRTFQFQNSQVNAMEITPDRQIIAAAGYQQILMYELASKNPCPTISYDGIQKNVTGLGFQEDGKWMYTGGEDMTARIWDMRGRSSQRIFQVSAPVTCVRLHPNQSELIVGDLAGVIHLWDLKTDHNEQLIPEDQASILDVAIDSAGVCMAAVNNRGHCYIWSLSPGDQNESTKFTPLHKIEAHSRACLRCRFSPDGQFLVTTSADQSARVWQTKDFSLVQQLHIEGQRWVWGADFTLDSESVVTASSDGMARLWDVSTGAVTREYSGHQKAVTALAFMDTAI